MTLFVAACQDSVEVQYLKITSFIINYFPVALCPCSVAYIMTFPVTPLFNGTVQNIQCDLLILQYFDGLAAFHLELLQAILSIAV